MIKMNDKKLWVICNEIYQELFKQAEPSADFDTMIQTGETKKADFFMRYYLPEKKQNEIIDTICKKHRLTTYHARKIRIEINLGCSPNSCKETWEKLT